MKNIMAAIIGLLCLTAGGYASANPPMHICAPWPACAGGSDSDPIVGDSLEAAGFDVQAAKISQTVSEAVGRARETKSAHQMHICLPWPECGSDPVDPDQTAPGHIDDPRDPENIKDKNGLFPRDVDFVKERCKDLIDDADYPKNKKEFDLKAYPYSFCDKYGIKI